MIRLSRLADYAVVLLAQMVAREGDLFSAHELSIHSSIPEPTVGKVLKALVRAGILSSLRGTNGGYTLARHASEISIAAIIEAVDGPIALTDCLKKTPESACGIQSLCTTRGGWQKINDAIYTALSGVMLCEIVGSLGAPSPSSAQLLFHSEKQDKKEKILSDHILTADERPGRAGARRSQRKRPA